MSFLLHILIFPIVLTPSANYFILQLTSRLVLAHPRIESLRVLAPSPVDLLRITVSSGRTCFSLARERIICPLLFLLPSVPSAVYSGCSSSALEHNDLSARTSELHLVQSTHPGCSGIERHSNCGASSIRLEEKHRKSVSIFNVLNDITRRSRLFSCDARFLRQTCTRSLVTCSSAAALCPQCVTWRLTGWEWLAPRSVSQTPWSS